ncbi:MAG: carboxypeptidase-like regulatory domain-containing protein, partial [Gammaproteobacteria bacterium]
MRYLRRPDEREQTGILSRARARHGDSRTRKARKRLLALLAALAVGVTAPAAHAYTGRVIDAETRQPIPGALVTLHDKVVLTDADGRFEIDGTAATLGFRAYGYQRSSIATEHFDKGLQDVYLAPFTPRALYMSFYG